MTLQKKLQINVLINNFTQRSSSYSSNYDYIYLDNLASSSYSNLFRSDLKNLKIKTSDNAECSTLYIPTYGSQPAAILVRVPVGKISQTTKLLLEVYDTSTTFSNTLITGNDVLMFDANSDTYSQFFMNYSGLSINNDSTDNGRFLRARFVPSLDGSSPTSLFTTFASGQSLSNGRVTVARIKRINGNVSVNDNATYHDSTTGAYMMQFDYNLTSYQEDMQYTSLNYGGNKSYCLFNGAETLVMASSFDAYSSGSDEEEDWKQYHLMSLKVMLVLKELREIRETLVMHSLSMTSHQNNWQVSKEQMEIPEQQEVKVTKEIRAILVLLLMKTQDGNCQSIKYKLQQHYQQELAKVIV